MSVFGGDSWAREAQQRKRRVEDLALEALDDASSYKKLLSGKYVCLLCPHSPILDSPLMLSVRIHPPISPIPNILSKFRFFRSFYLMGLFEDRRCMYDPLFSSIIIQVVQLGLVWTCDSSIPSVI